MSHETHCPKAPTPQSESPSELRALIEEGFAVMIVADDYILNPNCKGVIVIRQSAAPFGLRQVLEQARNL